MVPVIWPVFGSMLRPSGRVWTPATTSLNVPGSAPVAVTNTPDTESLSLLVWLAGAVTVGGTAFTFQVKLTLPAWPLSVALIVTVYGEPSPEWEVRVPVILPEVGSMLRPGGKVWTPATTSVNVPGSASVAVIVMAVTVSPSLLVCVPGLLSVGGVVSFTVQVKVALPLVPSSRAVIVTVYDALRRAGRSSR